MKGFDYLHLKRANKSRNKFDLSRSHLTTTDFGQMNVLYNEELVPGDDIKVKGSYFSRMSPLVKPTFGKADLRTLGMFVPYHQVAEDADAFISGKTTWLGQTPQLRFINNLQWLNFITSFYYGSVDYGDTVPPAADIYAELATGNLDGIFRPVSEFVAYTDPTDPDDANRSVVAGCDFVVFVKNVTDAAGNQIGATGKLAGFNFTKFGRFAFRILNSLGYTIPENAELNGDDSTPPSTPLFSMLPLLAVAHGYNDWMSLSQKFNTSILSALLSHVRQKKNYLFSFVDGSFSWDMYGYRSGNGASLTAIGLYMILVNLRICYPNDYFTSAWQEQNAPMGDNTVDYESVAPSPMNGGDLIEANYSDNFIDQNSTRVYQRSLDFLRAFDSWVRRNNYAGSRDVQQIYARFGIKTDDFQSHFARICGRSSSPIQVGDITQQSPFALESGGDVYSSPLGDYAGKGLVSGDGDFGYKSSDYGLFFILGWIQVKPVYPYGCDRKVLRTSPFDFFTPEFDAVGYDAVSYREVYSDPRFLPSVATDVSKDTDVFGFTERYNSYKYGRDQITGDFRNRNLVGSDVWHFGRDLTKARFEKKLLPQTDTFNVVDPESDEWNRIFEYTENTYDHFFMTCFFDVSCERNMLNLNEAVGLGTGDVEVARNGNQID